MTAAPTLAQVYLDRLAQFEGRRFCTVEEARRYLDIGDRTMRELLNAQVIRSQWYGHRLRKVIVASLLEYVDKHMPIDRPAPRRPS